MPCHANAGCLMMIIIVIIIKWYFTCGKIDCVNTQWKIREQKNKGYYFNHPLYIAPTMPCLGLHNKSFT